jgi:alpha-galactosidase
MVILDQNKPLFRYSGPGNWNDPDMLEVGVKRSTMLTPVEARSHFSFWALLSAPLLLGNDLRDLASIEPWVMDIITNRDVIAVNQDPAGLQGFPVEENVKGVNLTNGNCTSSEPRSCVRTETWIKPLSNNRFAVILFNRGGIALNDDHFSNEVMTLDWQKHLKVDPANRYYIKDLWNHKYVGVVSKQFTPEQFIAPHDLVMLTLTPVE